MNPISCREFNKSLLLGSFALSLPSCLRTVETAATATAPAPPRRRKKNALAV